MLTNIIKIFLIGFLLSIITSPDTALAKTNNFISVVNPIRGDDFWELKDQTSSTVVRSQLEMAQALKIPVTWLIRYDGLKNPEIVSLLNNSPTDEVGLFLEVTPSWTDEAGVKYHNGSSWHASGSVFLTGYSTSDREKLIDRAFEKFKSIFGVFPKSAGAWWVDAYSLEYMQKKYGITSSMIVADQYTTDDYQIWGQYWSTPYYPSKKNTLLPAQNVDHKLPVVMTEWAVRDPVNGYGEGVGESTYSLQINDYQDYHHLDKDYFTKLLDIYLHQPLNQFNFLVVGLENSYDWRRYKDGFNDQLVVLDNKRQTEGLKLVTLSTFSNWYRSEFPGISPASIISAEDPLGSADRSVWFMNPFYRVGWFYTKNGSNFRDIRPFIEGTQEACLVKICEKLQVTNNVTRILDDIQHGHKLILDPGKISNFKTFTGGNDFYFSYLNEVGKLREVKLMPRDISIDGETRTIDGTILKVESQQGNYLKTDLIQEKFSGGWPKLNILGLAINLLKFSLFLLVGVFIPGFLISKKLSEDFSTKAVIGLILGLVNLTLVGFITGYLKMSWLIIPYLFICLILFIFTQAFKDIPLRRIQINKKSLILTLVIILGVIYQSLPLFKSGLNYDFGMGFWGPLGHDGVWHQALINQLVENVPPPNPGLSGNLLTNYHYFYDLLVALTFKLTGINILDLIYRFFPMLFSILVGIGGLIISQKLFKNYWISLLNLYFIYFTGSFGWIVEYLRERHFGGESAFWVNQPVSMNLNPPFAISLVILIGVLLVINHYRSWWGGIILVILAGSLVEFKVYGGVIVLGSLGTLALWQLLKRETVLIKITFLSGLLSGLVFLPQNSKSSELLVVSPLWFVNSMIDFTDRVGWMKLSQARSAYFERGDYFKFILVEGLSLTLFIVGNLGVRIIGLIKLMTMQKDLLIKFILIAFIISILIPTLFIQKGNPWNTIQFFYYGLFLAALFTGPAIYKLITHWGKIGLILSIFFLIISPINAVTTFRSSLYLLPPSQVSYPEQQALTFLQNQPDGVVLTYPFDKNLKSNMSEPFKMLVYETSSYVSAFSAKQTFLEDEFQQDILQVDYKKRLTASYEIFNSKDYNFSQKLLRDNNIKYIYLPKLYTIGLSSDQLNLKQIFENSETIIYQVI